MSKHGLREAARRERAKLRLAVARLLHARGGGQDQCGWKACANAFHAHCAKRAAARSSRLEIAGGVRRAYCAHHAHQPDAERRKPKPKPSPAKPKSAKPAALPPFAPKAELPTPKKPKLDTDPAILAVLSRADAALRLERGPDLGADGRFVVAPQHVLRAERDAVRHGRS